MSERKLPIGYYLKEADNLLTERINAIHFELGITRTGWQILNSINQQPNISRNAIIEMLQQFSDVPSLESTIDELKSRHLIKGDSQFSLTETGQKIHAECLQKQNDFRNKSMAGITEDAYLQVIKTLQKLIENIAG